MSEDLPRCVTLCVFTVWICTEILDGWMIDNLCYETTTFHLYSENKMCENTVYKMCLFTFIPEALAGVDVKNAPDRFTAVIRRPCDTLLHPLCLLCRCFSFSFFFSPLSKAVCDSNVMSGSVFTSCPRIFEGFFFQLTCRGWYFCRWNIYLSSWKCAWQVSKTVKEPECIRVYEVKDTIRADIPANKPCSLKSRAIIKTSNCLTDTYDCSLIWHMVKVAIIERKNEVSSNCFQWKRSKNWPYSTCPAQNRQTETFSWWT